MIQAEIVEKVAEQRGRRICDHVSFAEKDVGGRLPYFGPVAADPALINVRAHGGYRQVVRCSGCGRVRHELRCGPHRETSPWHWSAEGAGK